MALALWLLMLHHAGFACVFVHVTQSTAAHGIKF
jgi:hypothetical protein